MENNFKFDIQDITQMRKMKQLYLKQLSNLMFAIAILALFGLTFYAISQQNLQKVARLSSQLEEAINWDKNTINDQIAEIRMLTKIIPKPIVEDGALQLLVQKANIDGDVQNVHRLKLQQGYFPNLNLNSEYIPVGDSKNLCFSFQWNAQNMWRVYSKYKTITDLPQCSEYSNTNIVWNKNDPITGLNVPLWKQNIEDILCQSSTTCKMACPGVYKQSTLDPSKGICYTYDILTNICFKIGFTINYQSAEGQWQYRSGCYTKGAYLKYERATPAQLYDFSNVVVEVRPDYKIDRTGINTNQIDMSFYSWISQIAFTLTIIGTVICIISRITLFKKFN